MKHYKKFIASSIAVVIASVGFAGCQGAEVQERADVPTKAAPKSTSKPKPPNPDPAVYETVGEANARQSAEDYLKVSAFSRKGLIEQLAFEGYPKKDATYGVDANHINWNAQAAQSAKSYLEMTSFSRLGLIEQLEFEGFTPAQAAYGVSKAGL